MENILDRLEILNKLKKANTPNWNASDVESAMLSAIEFLEIGDLPKITGIVKDIMQEGFEIAMGGDMDLSEEANRKEQGKRYDRAVRNYTEIIKRRHYD